MPCNLYGPDDNFDPEIATLSPHSCARPTTWSPINYGPDPLRARACPHLRSPARSSQHFLWHGLQWNRHCACSFVGIDRRLALAPEPFRYFGVRLVRSAIRRKNDFEIRNRNPDALTRFLAQLTPGASQAVMVQPSSPRGCHSAEPSRKWPTACRQAKKHTAGQYPA